MQSYETILKLVLSAKTKAQDALSTIESVEQQLKFLKLSNDQEELSNKRKRLVTVEGATYNTGSLFFANDMLNNKYKAFFENNPILNFVLSAKLDEPDVGYNNPYVAYERNWYCYLNDVGYTLTIQKMFSAFELDPMACAAVLYDAQAVIAGGFPLNCLVKYNDPEKFDGDLDIFVPLKVHHHQPNTKISTIYQYLELNSYSCVKTTVADRKAPQLYGDLTNIERVCVFEKNGRKVQVIVVQAPSALGYVRSFDISACQTVLRPLRDNSLRLQTRMLYHKLTIRGIMKLLKPVSFETDLRYTKRICKYMSRGFVPLLDYTPPTYSMTCPGFASNEEALVYIDNLLRILSLHSKINYNLKTFLTTLMNKIMYVMGSVVVTYCEAANPSNSFKHEFVELLNRFVPYLKGKDVQQSLQLYFTSRILTVSNIRWLLLAMGNHLDLFLFGSKESAIASRAGLSRDVLGFVHKLVDASKHGYKSMNVIEDVDVDSENHTVTQQA